MPSPGAADLRLDDESLFSSHADLRDPIAAGCASTRPQPVVLRSMDNGPAGLPPSSATATFRIPVDWSSGMPTLPRSQSYGRFYLCPTRLTDVSGHPSMEVLFGYLDPTVPYTEEGQARGYLDAIHHHTDDKVQVARIGVVAHSQFGAIILYHFSSAYWRERLYAGDPPRRLSAYPWSCSAKQQAISRSIVRRLRHSLASVEFHGVQPSHEDDPRRLQRGW